MELILWRHAEAEDAQPDMARRLTARGRKDAAGMAAWLKHRLVPGFTVLASPAERTQQTASALGLPFKTVAALAPGASVNAVLEAAGWPNASGTVVVVGHQPTLGQAVAFLALDADDHVSVAKGGVWWFESRGRSETGARVRAVLSPDLL
jgi:phosphohistidine phosphatase